MFVTGLGTAVPEDCYTQRECYEAFQKLTRFETLQPRSRTILRKVLLGTNGIESRHLALRPIAEVQDMDPNSLHARFIRHAPALATQAAQHALADSGSAPADIDALLICTCTGYLCPGLTSYVAEGLGFRSDVFSLDLVGQGCGAAIPTWRAAEALLASGRAKHVLAVCVEICSAAMYLDDDPGVLVSACLFGDGAGAAVLSGEPDPGRRRVEWKTVASVLKPAQRDALRFEQRDGMLRNILTLEVPTLAAEAVDEILGQTMADAGIARTQIRQWILHAGGRDVLRAVRTRLNLAPDALRWSSDTLREYGNQSSASIYFTLQRALGNDPEAGWWWLCSFGAGFTCHGALLHIESSSPHPQPANGPHHGTQRPAGTARPSAAR
jgi:alkylresorcinol/alkylpyrone synthase